ncbi:MAG: cupin domain-containing protein [Thermodesulfobacteriota bacterium]
MKADDLILELGLAPLPEEGGYFTETYRSELKLPERVLGGSYLGERSGGTAIYYLLTPDTFSTMHRLPGDEIYHLYLGGPVETLMLYEDGTGETFRIGTDIKGGERPQLVIPARAWQGSRLASGVEFALIGATMAPGFEFADFEVGGRAELSGEYPDYKELIEKLTGK